MCNFQGEATQLATGQSLCEQPVRGMDQAVSNRLPLCKKDTKSCEIDEARQATMKVGRKAPKHGQGKILEGGCSRYNTSPTTDEGVFFLL